MAIIIHKIMWQIFRLLNKNKKDNIIILIVR